MRVAGFLLMGNGFIDKIKEKVLKGEYLVSQHALIESAKDMVDDEDIEEAIANGMPLEDYPDDKRGHSCLICGKMTDGGYLHIVVGMLKENAVIITTYLPSPEKWETPMKRRK